MNNDRRGDVATAKISEPQSYYFDNIVTLTIEIKVFGVYIKLYLLYIYFFLSI